MPRIEGPSTATPARARKAAPAKAEAATGSASAGISGDLLKLSAKAGEAGASEKTGARSSGGFFSRMKDKVSGWLGGLKDAFPKLVYGLQGLWTGGKADKFETRRIESDPDDVNDDSPSAQRAAGVQTAAHAAEEAAALAKLSPENRAAYQKVADLAASSDPISRRELQKLLLAGKAEPLLPGLAKIVDQPLASGVDRGALLSDLIGELETPEAVAQHQKGTCGATTAQIYLIRKDPAEYVRIISDLASPEGKTTLKGGKTLAREKDWAADNDGGRSTPSRLFQPAAMELGDDKYLVLGYNNTKDKANLGPIPLFGGLSNGSEVRILKQLTGEDFDNIGFNRFTRDGHWDDVKKLLADGHGPIPVSMVWNTYGDPGGHFVQIDRVESGRVYYTNPWGQQESLSEAEFKSHITGAQAPTA